jgi:hypothetical protein
LVVVVDGAESSGIARARAAAFVDVVAHALLNNPSPSQTPLP